MKCSIRYVTRISASYNLMDFCQKIFLKNTDSMIFFNLTERLYSNKERFKQNRTNGFQEIENNFRGNMKP